MNEKKPFDIVIFQTKFIFEDVYEYMSEKDKKKIDNMTNKELNKFIENNLHDMEKIFESGIMYDWYVVSSEASNNLNWN